MHGVKILLTAETVNLLLMEFFNHGRSHTVSRRSHEAES